VKVTLLYFGLIGKFITLHSSGGIQLAQKYPDTGGAKRQVEGEREGGLDISERFFETSLKYPCGSPVGVSGYL